MPLGMHRKRAGRAHDGLPTPGRRRAGSNRVKAGRTSGGVEDDDADRIAGVWNATGVAWA